MNYFKKICSILLITSMATNIFAEGEDYQPEPSVFADDKEGQIFENKELENEVRNHKLAKQPETPKFEARTTSKPGFFDKISNWSNKRTLSKTFADHAKNSATDENIFSNKNNEAMWKTLSKEDQKDLVNEWFKNHETKRQQELQKDRKNYESSSKDYESGTKKRTLARVDNSYKEIKNLQSKIDKLEAERNTTANPSKKRNDLNMHIENLERKKETENENIKADLTLIAQELNSDEETYKETHSSTVKNQIEKINNFIKSINNSEFSKIEAELRKKSESGSTPKSAEPEILTDAQEARLAKVKAAELTKEEIAYKEFTANALSSNNELTVSELAQGQKLAKSAYGEDSPQYTTWKNLLREAIRKKFEQSKTISEPSQETESSSDNSTASTEELNPFKQKIKNWSYDEIESALNDPESQYSDQEKELLIQELPDERRWKYQKQIDDSSNEDSINDEESPRLTTIKNRISELLQKYPLSPEEEAEYDNLLAERDKLQS